MEIYLIVLNSGNYSARGSVNSNAKLVRFYRSVADDLLRDLEIKFIIKKFKMIKKNFLPKLYKQKSLKTHLKLSNFD